MKISINAGHTVKGPGYGAVSGSYKESQITRAVGNELIRILRTKGHTVHNSTVNYANSQNAYLKRVVEMANAKDVDLFVSLHCNAGGGQGAEVYTYKGKRLDKAVNVCNALESLGFKDRGIKDGSKLYVVKNTDAPALLVELFFLDNQYDRELYKEIGCKKIATAISKALYYDII